jgi:hypothetical protein
MSDLRAELGGRPVAATPYTILCPPGWQRVPPTALVEGPGPDRAVAQLKSAGRADLVLQLRGMLTRLRVAISESKAFDAYVAPLVDEAPLPAAMIVSPFVLPDTVSWEMALTRLAKGAVVEQADFTETPMWFWRRGESLADDGGAVTARASHYLVPVADDGEARRALHFQYSVLQPAEGADADVFGPLAVLGDLMMSTMRWRSPRA